MTFGKQWKISGIGTKNSTVNGTEIAYDPEDEISEFEELDVTLDDGPSNSWFWYGDDPPEDEYHGTD